MPYGFLKNQIKQLQKQLINILDENATIFSKNPTFNPSFFPLYRMIKDLDFSDFGIEAIMLTNKLRETFNLLGIKWKHRQAFTTILENLIILVQKQN